jgi:hypothetical protein
MVEKPTKPVPPVSSAPPASSSTPPRKSPPESPAKSARESKDAPPKSDRPAKSDRDEAWMPRIERERDLHGFKGNTPEADSILESPQIRNPEEDTAPLEGTRDRSDEDSLDE